MKAAERDEMLVRIDERVEAIHDRLARGDARLNSHSTRIGRLEKWRAGVVSAVAVLVLLIGWFVKVLS